jgi:hypothetical protein
VKRQIILRIAISISPSHISKAEKKEKSPPIRPTLRPKDEFNPVLFLHIDMAIYWER